MLGEAQLQAPGSLGRFCSPCQKLIGNKIARKQQGCKVSGAKSELEISKHFILILDHSGVCDFRREL